MDNPLSRPWLLPGCCLHHPLNTILLSVRQFVKIQKMPTYKPPYVFCNLVSYSLGGSFFQPLLSNWYQCGVDFFVRLISLGQSLSHEPRHLASDQDRAQRFFNSRGDGGW